MSEETSHMFEPFFTTKEKAKARPGLTVYGIIKQSGGFIWCTARSGTAHLQALLPRGGAAERRSRPRKRLRARRADGDGPGGEDEAPVRSVARQCSNATATRCSKPQRRGRWTSPPYSARSISSSRCVMPASTARARHQARGPRPTPGDLHVGYTDDRSHGRRARAGSAYVQSRSPDAMARKCGGVDR